MDKLKQLLMSHGEKLVAVLCGSLGIMALTSAHWSGDGGGSPESVISKVEDQERAINARENKLPDEELTFFQQIPNVIELTKDENQQLTKASDFALVEFSSPANRLKEKRTRPTILAALFLVADFVQFPLAMPPAEDEEEDGDLEDEPADKDDDGESNELDEIERIIREKLKRRDSGLAGTGRGASGMGMGGSGLGQPGSGMGEGNGEDEDEGMGMGAGMGMGGGMGLGAGMGMGPGMGMGGGAGSDLFGQYGSNLQAEKKRIRPSAGVSVRAIVPMQKQRKQLLQALHLKGGYQAAQPYIQYVDLQVQRRRVNDGQAEEWIDISAEDLAEILKDSFGTDIDIVSPAVTRNTITMPLPRRAAGVWLPGEASHPAIEDFVLNEEEKEMINKLNKIAKEAKEKMEAAKEEVVSEKGFSAFASSAVDVASSGGGMGMGMGEGYGEDIDDMMDQLNGSMGEGGGMSDTQRDFIDETLQTADQRLLLVRFMDFTVERGYAYQYRIRLEMRNPNYRHPLDELEDPTLASEPTLVSEWSEPTPATYVPVGQRIYLTDVRTEDKINISVYSDSVETGMPVFGNLTVEPGQRISGKDSFDVVDLTTNVLENREVFIESDDTLLTAEGFGRLSATDHPELKQFLSSVGRGIEPIPDQICILNASGDLEMRSVGDRSRKLAEDRLYAKIVVEEYEPWRKKEMGATTGGSPFDMGEGEGEGEGEYGDGLGMQGGSSASGDYYGGGGYGGGER